MEKIAAPAGPSVTPVPCRGRRRNCRPLCLAKAAGAVYASVIVRCASSTEPLEINMKLISLACLLLISLVAQCFSAEVKKDYPPTAASELLESACKKAAAESKMVFVKSGFPECGWCRIFDRYHNLPEVQSILGKHYVIVAIDTKYMPDGNAVFGRYAKPGAPSWVILSPQKKVIVDSYAPTGNVGYPLAPNETAHYVAALKKATPAISDGDLQRLSEQIKKAAAK